MSRDAIHLVGVQVDGPVPWTHAQLDRRSHQALLELFAGYSLEVV